MRFCSVAVAVVCLTYASRGSGQAANAEERVQLVDKFETMCMVLLCSRLSNEKKVKLLFDLFNFNGKGYLVESEISLLLLSVLTVTSKVDANWPIPKKPKLRLLQSVARVADAVAACTGAAASGTSP